MEYNGYFYRATDEYNTYEKHINAPYIRKEFDLSGVEKAKVLISGLGFYRLFVNGKDITKGLMAPYISNPDDIVYFDEYDVAPYLTDGINCFGIILGNGMQNSHGGRVWDFDIARFRNVPCFAFELTAVKDGKELDYLADTSFKCHPSPIIFDDIRSGCFYDANLEENGWNLPGFDDSEWDFVKKAENPRGEYRICTAEPITCFEEIAPVKISEATVYDCLKNRENMRLDTQFKFDIRGKKCVLFDFGINSAGIFRLKVNAEKGRKIFIQFCEYLTRDGQPSYSSTGSFYPDGYGQTSYYVCKGQGTEIFEPSFCYIGYRYACVFGLDISECSVETLTYLRCASKYEDRGSVSCSDDTLNKLFAMAHNSDHSNFYYFPTDCPHREKNGWTGDAACSAEHMLYFFNPESSYREWLRNICKAQNDAGALPGIVPTGGWGFEWGNGPTWDNILTELCWQIYRMRGDLEPARECAESMFRYLSYINGRRRADGLIAIGLGDWLEPSRGAGEPRAPLEVTDSVMCLYICNKSAELYDALDMPFHKNFAEELAASFKNAIRENLIDFSSMCTYSRCPTSQAMCIYFGAYEENERNKALENLVKLIKEDGEKIAFGMIGIRIIFHLLSDAGEGELAYKMITRPDYPSYGMFIRQGCTSLPESFLSEEKWDRPDSLNHHFFGDFTSWFAQRVAGLRVNPYNRCCDEFEVRPDFLKELDFAQAEHIAPCGKLSVRWERSSDEIALNVTAPEKAKGNIILPAGYAFVKEDSETDGRTVTPIQSGEYRIRRI